MVLSHVFQVDLSQIILLHVMRIPFFWIILAMDFMSWVKIFRCFAAWVRGCHCSTGLGSVSLGQTCRCDRQGHLIVESKQISRTFWILQVEMDEQSLVHARFVSLVHAWFLSLIHAKLLLKLGSCICTHHPHSSMCASSRNVIIPPTPPTPPKSSKGVCMYK